jgi:hypothetical protein
MTIESGAPVAVHADRRESLQWILGMAVVCAVSPKIALASSGDAANAWAVAASNFHGIYDDVALRVKFRDFLRNVYSIYPSDQFHALIADVCRKQMNDHEIYLSCQTRLKEITPIANQMRNALPALLSQTRVVGQQIQAMLAGHGPIDGYLEMGTKGGYIGYARSDLDLKGDLVLLGDDAPSYALGDVIERRVVPKLGRFVNLNAYTPISTRQIASSSLDVVCNPIGFHHIPLDRRGDFIQSLRHTLRRGGTLLVRDHDAYSSAMNQMVALAHDVFNMGLTKSWAHNQQEVRHFMSLKMLVDDLRRFGFKPEGKVLYQAGDPTLNAMMRFVAT